MAERVTIKGYLLFSVFISGLIYPLAVRLTWGGGYLAQLEEPFHDFAGSGVVHLVGGAAAFVGLEHACSSPHITHPRSFGAGGDVGEHLERDRRSFVAVGLHGWPENAADAEKMSTSHKSCGNARQVQAQNQEIIF